MTKNWIVICGLVRDPAAFTHNLETIIQWKAEGQIDGVVVSTWLGELANYPELLSLIESNAFTVVEMTPPVVKTVGHTIHQAKTLYYGLQAVPDDCMVLKMRPDMGPLAKHLMQSITSLDLEIPSPSPWPEVTKKKIVAAETFADSPYYINDIIYYGLREDLLQLATFDLGPEIALIHTAPEQFFFRGAFANKIPMLEAYLQTYVPFYFDQPKQADKRLDIHLKSDFYLDVFCTYVRFLDHYFRISFAGEDERRGQPQIAEGFNVRDLIHGGSGLVGTRRHPGALAGIFGDERPIKAILSGSFERNALGKRLLAALKRTSDPDYWKTASSNPLRPGAGATKLQAEIRKAFPDLPSRMTAPSTGLRYEIAGPSERVGLTSQTDEVAALATEINVLRRRVDQLTRELAEAS